MKVGDRVRVISADEDDIRWFGVGAIGDITQIVADNGECQLFDVRFDTGKFKKQFGEAAVWSVLSSQVEVVIE